MVEVYLRIGLSKCSFWCKPCTISIWGGGGGGGGLFLFKSVEYVYRSHVSWRDETNL